MENGNLRLKAGVHFSVLSVNVQVPDYRILSLTLWKYSLISTCIVSTLAPFLSFTICLFSNEHTVTYRSFQGFLYFFWTCQHFTPKSSQDLFPRITAVPLS